MTVAVDRTTVLIRRLTANGHQTRWSEEPRAYDWQEPAADELLAEGDEPHVVKLARALAANWNRSEPLIHEAELIAGCHQPKRILASRYNGDISCDRGYAKRLLAETDDPARRAVVERALRAVPESVSEIISRRARELGLDRSNATYWGAVCQGHMVIDYPKILRAGVRGIQSEVAEAIGKAATSQARDLAAASLVLYRGLEEFICAHADAAQAAARAESLERRVELLEIAGVCRHVAGEPATTFREALQLFWFTYLWDGFDNPGRFDQFMYPYYARDLATGRLTRDQARELLECLWVKFNEVDSWHLVLGGQTPDGGDASNDLTYLCLDVVERMRFPKPNVSLRWFRGTPPELLGRAIDVIGAGCGMPAIYNDEVIVRALTGYGIPLEDARDYAMGGCTEIQIPGKSYFGGEDGDIIVTKCLELALNDGIDPSTGLRMGPATGDARAFRSYDEVWEAYRRQVESAAGRCVAVSNLGRQTKSELAPKLFRIPLVADCLARGVDPDGGGARYDHGEFMTLGIAVTADSLAALKRVVFADRVATMAELLDALAADFAGHERLRQRLAAAPKFGNDDPEVDEIARQVSEHVWSLLRTHSTPGGGRYTGAVIVLGRNVGCGKTIGATPDGRHARQPLEDSCGAQAGMDRHGPTAAMRSAARLRQDLAFGGVLLNLKLTPSLFRTAEERAKLAQLVQGYFLEGGQQVQITVADAATLRAAQAEPEKYANLIVRVGGYSDYFVRLGRELQDDVIARTQHEV